MKVSPRACPDCRSPARGNPCFYYIDNPDYAVSGGDPPCSEYEYAKDAMARERRFGRKWLIVFAVAGAALAAIYFGS